MKVLVTGGTGFIGSYLVEELVRLGHVVRVATRDPSNLKWIEHLRNEIEVVKYDVTRVEEVRFAVRGVDVVYHLAAIFRHGTDEGLVWRVNYLGTKNVANEVLKEGCRLIHVSTVGTKVRFGIPPTIAKLIMKLRGGGIGGLTPEETIMLFTRNWFYRIDKLKSLGWKQTIPLSEGLKETIEWLRIRHNITM